MYDQEEYVFVPLEVSLVPTSQEIDACHASYLLAFFLFTVLLTMICLQCRVPPVRPPIIIEAQPMRVDEKV